MSKNYAHYIITGVKQGLGPGNAVPLRREINEWANSKDPQDRLQVELFLLALQKFQQMEPREKLSYFQIAGIHGQPFKTWDEEVIKDRPMYCAHARIQFPTWHRAYMLLFEQRVWETMLALIPGYPADQQAALTAAANTWRLPYWDWALRSSNGSYTIPDICRGKEVTVHGPNGVTTFDNPMFKFVTPGRSHMKDLGVTVETTNPETHLKYKYGDCIGTSRWPRHNEGPVWEDGSVDNDLIPEQLKAAKWYQPDQDQQLFEAVHRLLTPETFKSYALFASTATYHRNPPHNLLSLEDIHNNIHNWTANDGHMGHPVVAAFDPIFWVHHANIDRQLAIYQELNENSWFDTASPELDDPTGDYSNSPKTGNQPSQLPLEPFHADAVNFFDSDAVRQHRAFGYSYPETQSWLPKYNVDGKFDRQKYKNDIIYQINTLYGPSRRLILEKGRIQGGVVEINGYRAVPDHPDYVVNVEYGRFDLGGVPYTVHIYIGQPGEDGRSGAVGHVYNFSAPVEIVNGEASCTNCDNQITNGARSSGQVPITTPLLRLVDNEQTSLSSIELGDVKSYLKDNIQWKVSSTGGIEMPLERFPSLRVSVAAGKATHYYDDTQASVYHGYEVLSSVTRHRLGGYSDE